MKTWQMIKELTENPGKEFISREMTPRRAYVKCGVLFIVIDETGKVALDVDLNREWEEVKEPVDFMTAFKAFGEGKSIYSLRGLHEHKTRYVPSVGFYKDFHEADIASDKWYIED